MTTAALEGGISTSTTVKDAMMTISGEQLTVTAALKFKRVNLLNARQMKVQRKLAAFVEEASDSHKRPTGSLTKDSNFSIRRKQTVARLSAKKSSASRLTTRT